MAEFDNLLQGLLSLKPPGITTSKIKEFTTLCSQNVQSESILIQKLYMQFKKSPASHKLGILYIVDSVAREYMTQAKKANEEYSPSAPDGTYFAGLNRIKDILPSLINDMVQYAPEHKDKIYKLFDIWQRGATFPPDAIAQWRTKLASPPTSPNVPSSTTPLGSPPQQYQTPSTNGTQPQPAQTSQSNAASLLQALANMAKQNKPANTSGGIVPSVSTPPPATSTVQQTAPIIPPQQIPTPLSQQLPAQFNALGALPPNLAPNFSSLLPTPQLSMPQAQQPAQQTPAQFPQFPQAQIPLQPNVADPNLQAGQMALLQLLLQQPGIANLPVNQLGSALGTLFGAPPSAAAAPGWQQQLPQQQQPQPAAPGNRFDEQPSRDRSRNYSPGPRSPLYRRRSRSPPGPFGKHREPTPPFRRRSPTYNDYEEAAEGRGNNRDPEYHRGGGASGRGRGRRGSPRRDRSRSPLARNGRRMTDRFDSQGNEPLGPKFYERDSTVPPDSIKVYSRTLFVGGVARNTEQELRDLFENYGRVQTCIVNYDKRHAFIKMFTRKDAVAAKEGMEQYRSPEMTLRTRWGVGFGPRDCSDYTTGISIIPIDRLTDADKRWMLTAGNGGTGGQPLVGGIAVEEPDIEIGQGVSSKAMSKRRPADSGRGPQSPEDNPNHSRRNDRQQSAEVTTGGVAPPTPNFGSAPFSSFPYTFPQGMPAGWMFPSGQQQQ